MITKKMYVAELWRYPVKSLAGEILDSAEISADGIPETALFKCTTLRSAS
jgi:uncharacterized protein YcbX